MKMEDRKCLKVKIVFGPSWGETMLPFGRAQDGVIHSELQVKLGVHELGIGLKRVTACSLCAFSDSGRIFKPWELS